MGRKQEDRIDRLTSAVEKLAETVAALLAQKAESASRSNVGRPPQYSVRELVALLGNDEMPLTEWRDLAKERLGIGNSQFYDLVKTARRFGFVVHHTETNQLYRSTIILQEVKS